MHVPKPSKEQQLLFNILKGEVPTNLEGIDTKVLFDLFRRHRLFPLAPALFPMLEEEERKRWKAGGPVQNPQIHATYSAAAINFTEAFKMQGLEAIPFKGVLFWRILCLEMWAATSSDLDILVRNEDRQRKVIEVAGKEGYELEPKKAYCPSSNGVLFKA